MGLAKKLNHLKAFQLNNAPPTNPPPAGGSIPSHPTSVTPNQYGTQGANGQGYANFAPPPQQGFPSAPMQPQGMMGPRPTHTTYPTFPGVQGPSNPFGTLPALGISSATVGRQPWDLNQTHNPFVPNGSTNSMSVDPGSKQHLDNPSMNSLGPGSSMLISNGNAASSMMALPGSLTGIPSAFGPPLGDLASNKPYQSSTSINSMAVSPGSTAELPNPSRSSLLGNPSSITHLPSASNLNLDSSTSDASLRTIHSNSNGDRMSVRASVMTVSSAQGVPPIPYPGTRSSERSPTSSNPGEAPPPYELFHQSQSSMTIANPSNVMTQSSSPNLKSMGEAGFLEQKLRSLFLYHHLERFYPPKRYQALLQRILSINFHQIATQWRLPLELAYDLAPMGFYDVIFFCDDSGSMAFEEQGERIDDLKLILEQVCSIATLFDDDGMTVRFMNSPLEGNGIKTAEDVKQLINQIKFQGMTPIGTNLHSKVLNPLVVQPAKAGRLDKPVLLFVITDGEPSGEANELLKSVIQSTVETLRRTPYGAGSLAIQIAQVGKDQRAQRYLGSLDNDPDVGQMIDVTSYYELEAEEFNKKGIDLTPELWLLKICMGGIDPSYDDMD
jgi:hypothetical protein